MVVALAEKLSPKKLAEKLRKNLRKNPKFHEWEQRELTEFEEKKEVEYID